MKDKISEMARLVSECKYLSEEYQRVKLWGQCPDGDVCFESIMEWMSKNDALVEHMLSIAKQVFKA